MEQIIWQREAKVNTLVVNPQKRLGLVGLLSLLQDAAWEHADAMGFGYQALLRRDSLWALTKQRLRMERWPEWGGQVEIRTWSRPLQGFIARRDFEILEAGSQIGTCSTEWIILSARTRRPQRLGLEDFAPRCRPDHPLDHDPAKLDPKADWKDLAEFTVRHSDLDMQGHVNNTRYAQWVLDAIPSQWHSAVTLREFEANFLAETHLGEAIQVQAAPPDQAGPGLARRRFQGLRQADAKSVFLCQLTFEGGLP
jgi:acyl-ACP thioesterase